MLDNYCNLKKRIDNQIMNKEFKLASDKYINVGLLLEKELGIQPNDFSVADINGIELKTSRLFSKTPITLFSCMCDGPELFEIKRLVERFGIRDKTFTNSKVMYIKLSANKFSNWGRYLKMKLYIDRCKEKIYIMVFNANGKVIEKRSFWNFSTLDSVMKRKLNYLCFLNYQVFWSNGEKMCKFVNVEFFKYISFEKFLFLLESGDIQLDIKYGVYRGCYRTGKPCNHGSSFIIKKSALNKLFEHWNFEQKK